MSSRLIRFLGYGLRSRLPLVSGAERLTKRAPFVRDAMSVPAALLLVVIATLPAWALGLWFTGEQILGAGGADIVAALGPWRGELLAIMPETAGPAAIGLVYFLPLLIAALAAGFFWETLFAWLRSRPVDCGIFYTAWLFVLMLPAGASQIAL